jgi:hypothetical protein
MRQCNIFIASQNRIDDMTRDKVLNLPLKSTALGPTPRACQWPFGDPGTREFHFCNKQVHGASSYCKDHLAMAYRVPEPRRRIA